MADTLVKNPKLIVGTQSQVEAEMGDNDIGFATDIKFYTAKEVDDLLSDLGGGASLPILSAMMSDHVINDMSWLRADTFSWQSGDVYKAAYEHLLNDCNTYWEGKDQNDGSNWSHDVIDGIDVGYIVAPDGHKICYANQEANVSAIYNKTGVAWYFILDTENKQFKLPRTKWGFTGLRDSVGGYVAPGLPNIAGSYDMGDRRTHINNTVGAFYRKEDAPSDQWGEQSGISGNTQGVGFDASRSNAIYGASDTVQPAATQMYLYFYVGKFEQSAVEQTAGITSEQLNNKADISLFNAIYPVGSIYIGTQSTCPMEIAIPGSSWELLEAGRALWTGNGSNGNTKIAAGLPNITGTLTQSGLGRGLQPITKSGAFSGSSKTGTGHNAATNEESSLYVDFNASLSNSIYGNSTTVQPPAYVVNVWRRTA